MAAVERLMGVGVSPEEAKRTGFFIATVATAGSVNGPGNFIVRASGESLNLGSGFDLGDMVMVMFVTTGTCYPASSDQFNLKTTASGMVCTAGVAKNFVKYSATQWMVSGVTS